MHVARCRANSYPIEATRSGYNGSTFSVLKVVTLALAASCALLACGDSSKPGHARPADAAAHDAPPIDAPVSRLDAAAPDAPVSHLDANQPDAVVHVDAAPDAVVHADAAQADAAVQGDAGTPGVVTCYTEGNPLQSCTLPTHCCFSNYSSQHDGQCSTSTCLYGTISCDGPEDCSGGQHCCSHALFDTSGTVTGYSIACQATACGAAPVNYEICHIGGAACSNGGTCVTAYLNDNDLPRTLDICR